VRKPEDPAKGEHTCACSLTAERRTQPSTTVEVAAAAPMLRACTAPWTPPLSRPRPPQYQYKYGLNKFQYPVEIYVKKFKTHSKTCK